MAERYAVATGLWTAATFNGGTLPGVGDTVHANGYIVTIDQAITVAALSNRVGSIASAGGSFRVSSPGIVINADIYAGTEYTLSFTGASSSLIFNGDVFGSDTTSNAYAIYHNGTNLLVINGDVRGGSASSAIAVLVLYSGDLNVFGDIYGGTAAGGSCYGLRFTGTGICSSFGNVYGSTATSLGYGIVNASTTGILRHYGNVFGLASAGLNATQNSHTYVYGDAVGGEVYTCGGVLLSGSGTGNCYLYGTARSSATGLGPGVLNASTGSACILIQAAEQGAGGGWHSQGKVLFNDFNNIAFGVRNAANTLKTIGVLPHSSFSTPRAFT